MLEQDPQGVLFVCLGNICRSPTVEAVARAEFARAGLDVPVASCGTGDWHVGQGADRRALRAGQAAGYDLSSHRARQLEVADFSRYGLILGMDSSNMADLYRACPEVLRARVGLFLDVTAAAPPSDLPDPYNGTDEDFAYVVTLARRGVQGLIELLETRTKPEP
ncbi:MAG TPA: low molecular weight protein-tyrosine-phosphatase [Oleiagrimonas sp.]|nr:low molecular weight protein-tyrosine-phosphatase [Oleiagrimonas sp.]